MAYCTATSTKHLIFQYFPFPFPLGMRYWNYNASPQCAVICFINVFLYEKNHIATRNKAHPQRPTRGVGMEAKPQKMKRKPKSCTSEVMESERKNKTPQVKRLHSLWRVNLHGNAKSSWILFAFRTVFFLSCEEQKRADYTWRAG